MSLTFSSFSRCLSRVVRPTVCRRHVSTTEAPSEPESPSTSSSSLETLQTSLKETLTHRPHGVIKSILDPTPSHLLNLLLADLLPPACQAPPVTFFKSREDSSKGPRNAFYDVSQENLPQGYHLAYFPPAVPGSQLLADGTDTLHSPGPPFVRRLWAGGSVVFNPKTDFELIRMKGGLCEETIKDVKVKGTEGDEKIFVQISRRLCGATKRFSKCIEMNNTTAAESSEELDSDGQGNDIGRWSLSETRDLVFMKEKSAEQARDDVAKKGRVLKPNLTPDWSVPLTPTTDILFRWSALTYNAHRIHLDPQYCREVEGHRNMLVHGPLSLMLMLSSLRSQLQPGEMIMRLDYRNLAPLYVNEEMKICIRGRERNSTVEDVTESAVSSEATEKSVDTSTLPAPDKQRVYDIWIEGNEGGYAVKGTAVIGKSILPESVVRPKIRIAGAEKTTAKKQKKILQNAKYRERKNLQKALVKDDSSDSSVEQKDALATEPSIGSMPRC